MAYHNSVVIDIFGMYLLVAYHDPLGNNQNNLFRTEHLSSQSIANHTDYMHNESEPVIAPPNFNKKHLRLRVDNLD